MNSNFEFAGPINYILKWNLDLFDLVDIGGRAPPPPSGSRSTSRSSRSSATKFRAELAGQLKIPVVELTAAPPFHFIAGWPQKFPEFLATL